MLTFFNTLSKRKEAFSPLSGTLVRMYNCGPTVYDYAHIGNLRAYVFADVLRRTLEYSGYSVTQVMNLTDIGHLQSDSDTGEDKMVAAVRRLNKPETLESLKEVGTLYENLFKKDLTKLNFELPEHFPRASEHIAEQIELIQKLEKKGLAYVVKSGVYFDTGKFPEYGKLSGRNLDADEAGARIEINPEKRSPRDFVLWKLGGTIGFESPWGKGFPGWHIECSAMSVKYLGQPFDIHTGGEDLKFPHHENEIAESEGAAGMPLARFFLHNAFVNVANEKMAKSKQNFYTLHDIEEKGIAPLALRYLYLGTHYRSPLTFTFDALSSAETALARLGDHVANLPLQGTISPDYQKEFQSAMQDDLNTPKALAAAWDLVKDNRVSSADKRATLLDFDRVFGLNLLHAKTKILQPEEIPTEIQQLLMAREKARQAKNWSAADRIRDQIGNLGFEVKDTEEGQKVNKK